MTFGNKNCAPTSRATDAAISSSRLYNCQREAREVRSGDTAGDFSARGGVNAGQGLGIFDWKKPRSTRSTSSSGRSFQAVVVRSNVIMASLHLPATLRHVKASVPLPGLSVFPPAVVVPDSAAC